jgi:hypothetical protein
MSHPVNDELLETLYEEELDYFTKENKNLFNNHFTQDDIANAAEIMARKRFESMCY